ncbi:MAG: hypothetical protein GX879_04350 [Bacteroidales bacterium]|nr:hypothetical protein [Bacteroidales bacterium]
MKLRQIILLALLLCPFLANADGGTGYTPGARFAGMAGSSVIFSDTWSVLGNQAGMAGLERMSVGVSYENRFLLKETGFGAFAFQSPLGAGNIGFGVTHFGYSQFSENLFGLAYGQQLFKRLAMGVQTNYFRIHQPEDYGNLHAFSFELGFIVQATDRLRFAAHVANPYPPKIIGVQDHYLPTVIRAGAGYAFGQYVMASLEAEYNLHNDKPVFRFGLEYKSDRNYVLRTGISNEPVIFAFGFGYNFKYFNFDLAYSYHQVLGSTPHISLGYEF